MANRVPIQDVNRRRRFLYVVSLCTHTPAVLFFFVHLLQHVDGALPTLSSDGFHWLVVNGYQADGRDWILRGWFL
eukprot:1733798-Pyramimonas_sp.AAC.1